MKISELASKIIVIAEILNDSIELISNSYAMLVTDSSDKHITVSDSPFLSRCRDAMWKLGVIELNKLYGGKKDHYRLDKLLNELINKYKGSEHRSHFTLEELSKLKMSLSNESISEIKENLNLLRLQHYAHTDENPQRSIHELKLYEQHWKRLYNIAANILKTLAVGINLTSLNIKQPSGQLANAFLEERLENIRLAGKYKLHTSNEQSNN